MGKNCPCTNPPGTSSRRPIPRTPKVKHIDTDDDSSSKNVDRATWLAKNIYSGKTNSELLANQTFVPKSSRHLAGFIGNRS
jgi:hypothetical protein